MLSFIDLKLGPFDSEKKLEEALRESASRGYAKVGVAVPPRVDLGKYAPPLYPRVHRVFEADTRDPTWVSKLRPRDYSYRSVLPHTVEACRRAAGLRLVDGITLPTIPRRLIFDEVCARRLASLGGVVEVKISPVLRLRGWELSKTLWVIGRELQVAAARRIPILITTGAADRLEIPDARSVLFLTESLLGLSPPQALAGLTAVPEDILSGALTLLRRGFAIASEDAKIDEGETEVPDLPNGGAGERG